MGKFKIEFCIKCGKPVITGNSISFREIAGDDAVFVDPKDEKKIYESLL